MAVTLKQAEAVPEEWPDAPEGLSAAAAALDPAMIWGRIEAYTVHRWATRAVVWTVEGPGDWTPPLAPATVETVEVWDGTAWAEVFPAASPWGGYVLACGGPYQITAEVGGGDVPAPVAEAFRRLAEYMGDAAAPSMVNGRAGASATSYEVGGNLKVSFDRSPAWLAKAIVNSGAGDLLRPWREAV